MEFEIKKKNPIFVNNIYIYINLFLSYLPYHRRNFLEAQVLEQITEITVDQFQLPYDC